MSSVMDQLFIPKQQVLPLTFTFSNAFEKGVPLLQNSVVVNQIVPVYFLLI